MEIGARGWLDCGNFFCIILSRALPTIRIDMEMIMQLQAKLKIVVAYDPPVVPWRVFDWWAHLENHDPENDDPVGYGQTPSDAVLDLFDKIELKGESK